MEMDALVRFLLWNTVLHYLLLLLWFGAIVWARETIYQWHTRWFLLSEATFDAVHYGGMALYKIGILLFSLVPLLVLCALY